MNQELLDRLQEADPDTYHEWQWGLMQCSKSGVSIDMNGALAEAWLQASLQAAIWARLWWYELSAKGECVAIIGHGNVCIAEMLGDTEAEALALAYLAAIEAIGP